MVTVARAPIAVAPNIGMSQSGLMVAALVGGFIVFVAMQGKLANYWSILLGGGASSAGSATTPSTTTPSTTTPSTTTPSTTSPTLPAIGNPFAPSLGGTANPFAPATGGTGTPTSTGIPGLPNISLDHFFGLEGG